MLKSVNQIRLELSQIQQSHLQLNSFFWGDFLRAYKENTELNYPLMGGFYPNANLLNNQTQLQLTIFVCDKMYKDWSNLNDVESDTLQICRDVYNVINSSTRWQKIGRVQSCSVSKFIERGGDEVAGHTMTFQLLLRDKSGVCDLPMPGYDFDQVIGIDCSPVQVFKDGILVATIPSGGVYEYVSDTYSYSIINSVGGTLYSGTLNEDFTQIIGDATATLKDSLGNVLSVTEILAEGVADIEAPDATIQNTDMTYFDSLPSGSTNTIADTTYNIYVNSLLTQTTTIPSLKNETINIIWQ
jgi:hypothetical protein